MEIWISSGNRKELKKAHPFLRDFGVIDVKEIAQGLGYKTSVSLDENSAFILSSEIRKRLEYFSYSRRFYRVLYLVEEFRDGLAEDLLRFSEANSLKYESVFIKQVGEEEFLLGCKNY